jgi:hypothetical protein
LLFVFSLEQSDTAGCQDSDYDSKTNRERHHLKQEIMENVLARLEPIPSARKVLIIDPGHFPG